MTIALGIIGRECLVIGADTQETYGDQKYHEGKIISGWRTTPNPDGAICITGAGAADHIDAASEEILNAFQDFKGTMDEFEVWLRKFIARFYSRHVMPFIGKTEEIPGFRLLIGARHEHQFRLWTTARTVLTSKIPYAVVGLSMGSSSSLLGQLYPASISFPSLDVTAMLATYVIRQAKLSSDGIGLETEIRFIYREKTSIVPQKTVQGWENLFVRYQALQRDLFLNVVGHSDIQMNLPGTGTPTTVERPVEVKPLLRDLRKIRREFAELPIIKSISDLAKLSASRKSKRVR